MGTDLREGERGPMAKRGAGRPPKDAEDKGKFFYFSAKPKLARTLCEHYHAGEYVSYAEMFREMLTYAMRHGHKPKGSEFDE